MDNINGQIEAEVKNFFADLQKEIHSIARDKGFYEEKRNIPTRLMLIVSEISEAMEADRKDKRYIRSIQALNGWTSDEDFRMAFQNGCKDTFEDELADAVIRILDLAEAEKIDLYSHILAKIRYNKTRGVRHGGKKY